MIDGSKRGLMQVKDVRSFLDSVLDEDIHTKRIASLANATLGVMTGASLGVAVIGKSLAQARGLLPKHAVKQVDRLLSNPRIEAWDVFASWVPEMVGPRKDIVVAMDWTDFDADGQATLALKLVTRHGRATPLIWLSVHKDELSNARNDYEDAAVRRLAEVLPDDVKVTILADRGFADTKLFGFLDELGFDYVIRLKGNTKVSAADGPTRPAAEWVGQGGRARKLRDAVVTEAQCPVGAVVCVQAKDMKEAWCLAASNAAAPLTADYRPLFKTLGRGAELPRYQGSALRHGPFLRSHQRPATARPAAAAQCVRRRSAHPARRRRREPRHGPPSQVQHRQDPHPFPVPPGLHALRPDPQHARTQAAAPRGTIRRNPTAIACSHRNLCHRIK